MADTKKVGKYGDWATSTNASIERIMDNAAYSSAHPDDTIVLVGPPRLNLNAAEGNGYGDLAAVGMVQSISVNQSKPFQPMMAIGSSRSFYLGGKAQGSAQIGRLFLNTDNLLKRLYLNNIGVGEANGDGNNANGVDPAKLDSANPAGAVGTRNFLINLDSEFFLIPFGMGVIFKNKARQMIGGFYMELMVLPNYTISVQAGQSMILEGVTALFDRLVPLDLNQLSEPGLMASLDKLIDPDGAA
jgi:hypothetical protein